MTFIENRHPSFLPPIVEVQSMEKEKEGNVGGNLEGEKITPRQTPLQFDVLKVSSPPDRGKRSTCGKRVE